MKKVKWRWDMGCYIAFCPYCNEPAYFNEHCEFCGKEYKWREGRHKPREVVVGKYTVTQTPSRGIYIYDNDRGRLVWHSASREKQNDELVQMYRDLAEIFDEEYEKRRLITPQNTAEKMTDKGYRKQEWISVDERLPEENGRYLVCVNISHLAFTSLTIIAVMEYGKQHGFYLYSEDEPVTHWMPLPEAPKMKGGVE